MLPFDENILLITDSYKLGQWKQYPPKTQHIYSYFESRGGVYDEIVFFGLQYLLKRYLAGAVVTQEKIDQAAAFTEAHVGPGIFNRAGWEHVLTEHGGRLPVEIRAVPEGLVLAPHHVLMTVENTDPRCWWLTNVLETLLVQCWYPCTVASRSRYLKKLIKAALVESGTPEAVDFKLHDFGFRGVSSVESAALGDAAHLTAFSGTDTIAGILLAQQYYATDQMLAFNIPASEHATMTSWGREHEVDAFRNMLEQFPTGLVSVVSDSYDIFAAARDLWGGELREQVLERDGTLVIRPDSGPPVQTVLRLLDILGERFGTETNDQGYRVLHPNVRVIQGDGIDDEMVSAILDALLAAGWSADNLTFGSGGGLLQKLNRDTLKFAFKASNATIDGTDRPVYKDPVTDPGKQSKRGRLWLYHTTANQYTTYDHPIEGRDNLLQPVFRDGALLQEWTFEAVRERAAV